MSSRGLQNIKVGDRVWVDDDRRRIICNVLRLWQIDNETDNVSLYRQKIETAKDCAEFTQFTSTD